MPRVLVVDDQKDVRAMIIMVLKLSHFEVSEAENIKGGLQAFGEADFDAAVVDVFLKDESGFDLIAALRERSPGLPVVAVSGLATLDAVARSAELSSVVCLQKPFRPVELIRAIETARGAAAQAAPKRAAG
ncbi:MAG TPA: response regulator [Bradyrhizobium sp.]|uniref:response regulator n=1 Tax=Bradyrhizobium sp. TaxID=376 RepID=UPI002C926F2E|nr:response regulator [Bradyrhizobium sp.]HLZ06522.1 response regulator [Bradyrhizobium sp.]